MRNHVEGEQAAALQTEALLNSLQAPRPDIRPNCKAMIGQCQVMTVWMAANIAAIVSLLQPGTSDRMTEEQLAAEVRLLSAPCKQHAKQKILSASVFCTAYICAICNHHTSPVFVNISHR